MSALAGAHPQSPRIHADLVGVLRSRAQERPDQTAYSALLEGGAASTLTYAQLDRRARAVGAQLQEMGLAGHRALLAYPHGLEFITGLFGCLYAGCVAVPTQPPHRRTLDRFRAIVADAGASVVLSAAPGVAHCRATPGAGSEPAESEPLIRWLATDEIPDALADRWRATDIAPETLAMLQYTSGSISAPKGVMLTHANLIANTRAIREAFGMGRDSGLFWLPLHHDMGLVGAVLEPLLAGVSSSLMSPAAFLRRPAAWLEAISERRATISGGPNFAYDLCVRRITDEQRATLDLSCWSLAFVGAEPIRPETLERFAAAFAPCGFKPAAFYPCYGLAEATLMVSGAARAAGPTMQAFDDVALSERRVEPVASGAGRARRLVSCGAPVGDGRLVIVDSRTCAKAAPGRVGEIWIAGASVGQGYWRKPAQTRRSFDAHLANTGEGPFLRTGDLGFVSEGHLYVVGREDDLLIVRGLNHHPQDLEATARASHPLLEAGLGAAFAVDDRGSERLVLVQEATRTAETDLTPALSACREATLDAHGLAPDTIVLVRCGTIPKTSSGKVQRRACRAAFLAGELKALAEHHRAAGVDPVERSPESLVLATVCQHALALGGAALSEVTPETSLAAIGLDSLRRVELAATLERAFACRLPDAEFNAAQTLGDVARAVQQRLSGHPRAGAPGGRVPPAHYEPTLFPECVELKRYERMLRAVAGDNPYFRADQGGNRSASVARVDGQDLINFCAYDYIGMAHDPRVAAAAKAAVDRYGASAGASRLVSGEKQVHRDLEQALAAFLGTEAALVFVSGHATNVTTIGHLFGPEDLIVYDALAHNSIIQGAQLSGATRRAFAHNDWRALDALLTEARPSYRRALIAIEGVYSMDGDSPELPRFVELKRKHKALMLVDEAHSLGTMGATGRGIGERWGTARADVDLWMGTLSKSLASCGGYLSGSAQLIEYLAYTAPGFVYSVGLSPPNAAAALAALTALGAEPWRVARLGELSALFLRLARERGLDTGLAEGAPVIPVIVGNSVKSLRLARALLERGVNVQPILHPAVPERSARLRFFITTNHTETQVRDTVGAIADEMARL